MAQKSLIRGLAALSLACLMITAVFAQGTRSYPFTEVDRSRKSSDIEYDLALSRVPPAEAARQLMCGAAWLTLERGFIYFSADPDRGQGSATLDFYEDPPRRSSVVASSEPVQSENFERAVIDASWLAGVCQAELDAAQAEPLGPDELQAIRVRAQQIPLAAAGSAPEEEAPEIICTQEPRLGSFIPQQRCTTQAEIDRLREASSEWFRSGGDWGGIMEVNTIE